VIRHGLFTNLDVHVSGLSADYPPDAVSVSQMPNKNEYRSITSVWRTQSIPLPPVAGAPRAMIVLVIR
jgi:hypothetical protein